MRDRPRNGINESSEYVLTGFNYENVLCNLEFDIFCVFAAAFCIFTQSSQSVRLTSSIVSLLCNIKSCWDARGSAVGILTRYGLDGPGIEFLWERNYLHLSRPTLVPTQPPVQCLPGFFPDGKAA